MILSTPKTKLTWISILIGWNSTLFLIAKCIDLIGHFQAMLKSNWLRLICSSIMALYMKFNSTIILVIRTSLYYHHETSVSLPYIYWDCDREIQISLTFQPVNVVVCLNRPRLWRWAESSLDVSLRISSSCELVSSFIFNFYIGK